MSFQPTRRSNSASKFRRNTLIIGGITALATLLMVPPAWWSSVLKDLFTASPPPAPAPVTRPTDPAAASVPPVASSTVCGRWRSSTSQKNYLFVCKGESSFQIREISGDDQANAGAGNIRQNGKVEADLLIAKKDRTAHLRLQLSDDGQRLVGTWYGDNQNESGTLSFYRVE